MALLHALRRPVVDSSAVHRNVTRAWVLLLFLAISAWCVDSFARLWSLCETYERNGVQHMIDNTAHRPFAYRVLVPTLARAAPSVAAAMPEAIQARLSEIKPPPTFLADPSLWRPPFSIQFMAVHLLTYGAIVALMYLLLALSRTLVGDRPGQLLHPVFFVALLPLTFLHGGYFYDFFELMFVAAMTLALLTGRDLLFAPLLLLAVLNKESNILLSAITLPLLLARLPFWRGVLRMTWLTLPALVALLVVRAAMADNPGVGAEFQLSRNLSFWLNPASWFGTMTPYAWGISLPRSSNILLLLLGTASVARAWGLADRALRHVFLASAAVSLPLMLLFCFLDEMRNLSLMFIPLYCLVVAGTGDRREHQTT